MFIKEQSFCIRGQFSSKHVYRSRLQSNSFDLKYLREVPPENSVILYQWLNHFNINNTNIYNNKKKKKKNILANNFL